MDGGERAVIAGSNGLRLSPIEMGLTPWYVCGISQMCNGHRMAASVTDTGICQRVTQPLITTWPGLRNRNDDIQSGNYFVKYVFTFTFCVPFTADGHQYGKNIVDETMQYR